MDNRETANQLRPDAPPAVVVGLCAHGVTLVHALARMGVEVVAVESNSRLPGCRTRRARVHMVESIQGDGLIRALAEVAHPASDGKRPVLFLTNDDMVRTVADRWDEISGRYSLSWAHCRNETALLLSKSEHQARSIAAGCSYPPSRLLNEATGLDEIVREIGFPAIAKPVRPLSSFKVRILPTLPALAALCESHRSALPFIVQKYIPGGDDRIFFSALYLSGGRVLARFDGRKLRSWPLGHTTVAEPCPDDEINTQALRFFAGLGLSGPVSLELKRDDAGRPWVIEPTVGRTDFWIGLCVANGVNLPWIEYCDQAGIEAHATAQADGHAWLNPERDPRGLFWYARQVASRKVARRRIAVTYSGGGDTALLVAAASATVRRHLARSLRLSA